jgi:hypothetical protein
MNLEPKSIQPTDSLMPPTSKSNEVEEALHLLELDPAASPSLPSLEETAAAIDSELEAAVQQSATPTQDNHPPSDSPLEELYAQLLEENSTPSSPAGDNPDDPDWWELDDFALSSATITPTPATPSKPFRETSRAKTPGESTKRPDFDWVEAPTAADTIAALTDLLPETAIDALATANDITLQTWESLQVNPDAPIAEESYLQASPEENLLPTEDTLLEQEQNLQLDPSTMQQLESDLHRLEGTDTDHTTPISFIEPENRQPTDAELDAIFPAFLLGATPNETTSQEEEHPAESPTSPIPPDLNDRQPPEEWYLGLDFGTTGISAVLLHRPTATLYPIYWWQSDLPHPPERVFRLPSTVYVSLEDEKAAIVAVGFEALDLQTADAALGDEGISGLLLQGFKSCLNAGLSWTDDLGHPQPIIQWSLRQSLPLERVQIAVQVLLATLTQSASVYDRTSEDPTPIDRHPTALAVPPLAGIAIGISHLHSEAYRFNLREAVFQAKLVQRPEQVAFLEESIATVLSALPSHAHIGSTEGNWQFSPEWGGTTLTIEAGASTTELVLVDLPINLDELTHHRFQRQSFPYGGHAIDQDIICQLLFHEDWLQAEFAALQAPEFPQPGEPDLSTRIAFGQWLQSSSLGLFLLDAAAQVKIKLQDREKWTIEWGNTSPEILRDRSIQVQRQDLESRILVTYVQRLNRELNGLLSRTGVAVEGINQALCAGGSASWKAIARWLRQKLPNATIAQDVYPSGRSTSCSRVAYGLAALPLYPNLLGTLSPHYSDYFLLRELLEAFPNCALSLQELLPLLERRGINVRICQPRILEFLEGRLPLGLIPTEPEAQWLTPESKQHPLYLELTAMPLFESVGDPSTVSLRERTYRPRPEQVDLLRQYLHRLTVDAAQTLEDPQIVSLGVGSA